MGAGLPLPYPCFSELRGPGWYLSTRMRPLGCTGSVSIFLRQLNRSYPLRASVMWRRLPGRGSQRLESETRPDDLKAEPPAYRRCRCCVGVPPLPGVPLTAQCPPAARCHPAAWCAPLPGVPSCPGTPRGHPAFHAPFSQLFRERSRTPSKGSVYFPFSLISKRSQAI